jgi:hypothetical protein
VPREDLRLEPSDPCLDIFDLADDHLQHLTSNIRYAGVNARDRIGRGPWQNTKGVVVAKSVEDLHSDSNNINKQTALTEKGEMVSGRGDPVNTHDILTGSDPQGLYSTAGGDTTCGNWTKSGDGSAIVGHHDRAGLKDTRHMNSWNSSHGSRGCSQDQLKASAQLAGPMVRRRARFQAD